MLESSGAWNYAIFPKVHIANDGIFGYTKSIDYDKQGKPEYAYLETAVEVQNETLENKIAVVEVFLTKDAAMRS